ncbi:hypothetical protein [Pikeienuella piscinae]|nr:hypothetical protein [Pikeienuella piscinae]
MTDNNKSQRDRFEKAARELGVDLDEEKLKKALRKIAPEKPEKEKDE